MVQIGSQVDKYVVEQELGAGGMATVYRVRHAYLGSTHALKVLFPHLATNESLRARFLAEGQIQAQLRHANILSVTDLVAAPGVAGLVMEYVEGGSLAGRLHQQAGPASPAEVRRVFLQVLAGVGYAHSKGFIHRDIKPENILLDGDGQNLAVKVADFGIAKAFADDIASARLTSPGGAMGTPQYMSPEQIQDPQAVTAASDIFSLGVTLYELATGALPFNGGTTFEIQLQVVKGRYPAPRERHPGVDPAIAAAIEKALQPRPEDRFASCEQFAAALGAAATAAAAAPGQAAGAAAVSSPATARPAPRPRMLPSDPAQLTCVDAEMVLDTTCNMLWQRKAPVRIFGPAEALKAAATVPLDGGGWRLPTTAELVRVLDANARHYPSLFEGLRGTYWTGDTDLSSPGAKVVLWDRLSAAPATAMSSSDVARFSHYLRCVKDR